MKLFCFPYAGGSATVYRKWKRLVNNMLEIVPVEIPGRGTRFSDELCDNMDELVEDLYLRHKESFLEGDYMLYGHSMGSWIVYYLMNRLVKENITLPRHLFLSGKEAPHIVKGGTLVHKLSSKDFIEKIYSLGGTPRELFDNKDMMEIFIPILRNDYKLIETCRYQQPEKPFECGITIFNGTEDDMDREDIEGWRKYTTKEFEVYHFNGGHFFIHNYSKEMLDCILKQVKDKSAIS